MSEHPQQWQPNQPPPPGAYSPMPPKKNWFLRHKILTLLLGLLLIGGVSAALGGGGAETEQAGSGATGGGDDTPDATAADEPAEDAPAAKKPEGKKEAGVGDGVRDGKFEFVVTKVAEGPKQIGDEFLNEKAQGRFILVTIKVTNIGDQAQTLSDSDQKLFDGQGRSYAANSTAALIMPDNKVLYASINPGNSVTGTLVFDLPQNAKPTQLELHDSLFSGGVKVDLA